MTRSELAETIVRPAEAVGLTFEAGLAETILDDVGDEPGGLPLLEFPGGAVEGRRQRPPALRCLPAARPVPGAIAHRAEEVFKKGLSDAERQAAQRLLIRMVRPGEGVEDTRQRASMPEADPIADDNPQAGRRPPGSHGARRATGRETAEVAHEALIRGGDGAAGSIRTGSSSAREADRRPGAAVGMKAVHPTGCWCGRPLAEGEDLLATRRADLEPLLVEYIEASAAAAQAENAWPRRPKGVGCVWRA